jgi:hypothetical protein
VGGELKKIVDRLRYTLYRAEGFSDNDRYAELPPPGTREHARYLDRLDTLADKRTVQCFGEFRQALDQALDVFARAVPRHQGLYQAPVAYLIEDIGGVVEDMARPFFDADPRLFTHKSVI